MVRFARGVCLSVAVAWVVSCGGGGGTPTTPSNTTPSPPAVTLGSVTVTAPAAAAKVGDSAQFIATAVMSNSTTQTVTTQSSWQSSNTGVATVTTTGMVAAVGAGEADIRATYQSVTGLVHIVVTAVTSSSFSLCGTMRGASNAALSGAEAEIRTGSDSGKRTSTDNSGNYCFTAVRPGTFTVRASKTDYNQVDQNVTVSGNTTLNFTLTPTPGMPSGNLEADLTFCVTETNRYRATQGLSALTRSTALEAYTAAGARQDGLAHAAHQHFVTTSGGGIALAENELPWWSATSVHAVIQQGLAGMWAEGPGGGHYENMRGSYTKLGCGVFVNGNEITVVQDFGR